MKRNYSHNVAFAS